MNRNALNVKLKLHKSLVLEDHISSGPASPSCIEFFEALETESSPYVAVLVLTVFKDKEKGLEARDAWSAASLSKASDGPETAKGLQDVFFGDSALTPSIAKMVVQELRKPDPAEEFNLSAREVEVLEKLAEGLPVKKIAAALDICEGTASFHLTNIYKKLQVQSQAGAVAKALRAGII